MSGVKFATYCRFGRTGEISLMGMLQISAYLETIIFLSSSIAFRISLM